MVYREYIHDTQEINLVIFSFPSSFSSSFLMFHWLPFSALVVVGVGEWLFS